MKALVVRPGICEIPERLLKNNLKKPLYEVLKEPNYWKTGVESTTFKSLGPIAVANKLIHIGIEVDTLELMMEYGIAVTGKGIEAQEERILAKIKKGKYDFICISCTGCYEYLGTKRVAEVAKRISQDMKVIVGGYHPSSDANDMMESIPEIDIIVIGDFEPVAGELIAALQNKINMEIIPNLVYRINGKIKKTERKLYRLTFEEDIPHYTSSPFDTYYPFYVDHLIEGSRGCSYNKCSFCVEPLMRNYYTCKPVDRVIEEMEYTTHLCKKIHGKDHIVFFTFSDPLWGGSRAWIKEFCEKIKVKRKTFELPCKWEVQMRIDQKINDLFPLMCEAGCNGFSFGVESLIPSTLRSMCKAYDIDKYYETIKDTMKAAVNAVSSEKSAWVEMNIIVGWPGDEMRSVLKTFEEFGKIKKETGKRSQMVFCPAIPYTGTKLWEIMLDPEYKEKYGLKMEVPRRFWKEGISSTWVPMFSPSRTLSASALANYTMHVFKRIGEKGDKGSLWMSDMSFGEKLLSQDYISQEDLLHYIEMMRIDYAKTGESSFFI